LVSWFHDIELCLEYACLGELVSPPRLLNHTRRARANAIAPREQDAVKAEPARIFYKKRHKAREDKPYRALKKTHQDRYEKQSGELTHQAEND
jgi:hypothetical protein